MDCRASRSDPLHPRHPPHPHSLAWNSDGSAARSQQKEASELTGQAGLTDDAQSKPLLELLLLERDDLEPVFLEILREPHLKLAEPLRGRWLVREERGAGR